MSQLRSCPPRSTVNIWRRSPLLFSHIFTSFSFAMLKGKLVLDVPKFHVKKHGMLWTIQVSHHQTSPAPKGTRTSEQWQACRGWRFLLPASPLGFTPESTFAKGYCKGWKWTLRSDLLDSMMCIWGPLLCCVLTLKLFHPTDLPNFFSANQHLPILYLIIISSKLLQHGLAITKLRNLFRCRSLDFCNSHTFF